MHNCSSCPHVHCLQPMLHRLTSGARHLAIRIKQWTQILSDSSADTRWDFSTAGSTSHQHIPSPLGSECTVVFIACSCYMHLADMCRTKHPSKAPLGPLELHPKMTTASSVACQMGQQSEQFAGTRWVEDTYVALSLTLHILTRHSALIHATSSLP